MPTAIEDQILAAIQTAVSGEYGQFPQQFRSLPATRVLADDNTAADNQYGETACTLPLVVARAEEATSTAPSDMRAQGSAIIAALVSAMFADETFGGLADNIEYLGGGRGFDGKTVFGSAQFNIYYRTERGDITAAVS